MIRAQLSVYNTYLQNVQAFQVSRAAFTNLTQKRSYILHKRTSIYTLGLFLVHLPLKAKKAVDFLFGKPHHFHHQNACFPEEDKLRDVCFLVNSPPKQVNLVISTLLL